MRPKHMLLAGSIRFFSVALTWDRHLLLSQSLILPQSRFGVLGTALAPVCEAQLVIGIGLLWPQANGGFETICSGFQVTLFEKRLAQLVIRIGIIRFLTDRRSRKIADLRHTSTVGIIFQNDGDDGFASLTGAARLIEDVSEVRALWKEDAHARYFPTGKDRANAGFIEVRIERMELWIRGVTPEPFGLHATTLQRNPNGAWYWAT